MGSRAFDGETEDHRRAGKRHMKPGRNDPEEPGKQVYPVLLSHIYNDKRW